MEEEQQINNSGINLDIATFSVNQIDGLQSETRELINALKKDNEAILKLYLDFEKGSIDIFPRVSDDIINNLKGIIKDLLSHTKNMNREILSINKKIDQTETNLQNLKRQFGAR